jgi:hypothetical protein
MRLTNDQRVRIMARLEHLLEALVPLPKRHRPRICSQPLLEASPRRDRRATPVAPVAPQTRRPSQRRGPCRRWAEALDRVGSCPGVTVATPW